MYKYTEYPKIDESILLMIYSLEHFKTKISRLQ